MSATASTLTRLRRARGQHATAVRWFDLVGPVLLVAVLLTAAQSKPAPAVTGRGLVVTLALLAFVVGVLGRTLTGRRRTAAGHRLAVALILVGAVILFVAQPRGPGAECVLLGILCSAVLLPAVAAAVVLVIGFAAVGLVDWLVTRDGITLVVLAGFAALYGVLYLAFRLAAANRAAERLLVELDRSRAAETRAAGLAERQRLAREMHDVLAHSLTGLLLQLEGVRIMAGADANDPRLPAAIDRAQQLGRTGLDEARRAIGMLRGDVLPGPDRLAELAEQYEHDRDVPVSVTVTGPSTALAPNARVAIYRVAQEALTNVTKHAQAERVEIHLACAVDAVRLTVEDFGSAPPACTDRTGGYGLTGMRERAELLGGTLVAAATAHGFRVELDVPVGTG